MLAALNLDDRDFVTDIFDEYGKQLYHIAFSILKNEHDASDALQETMYKVIRVSFQTQAYEINQI